MRLKIIKTCEYYVERLYPYFCALIAVLWLYFHKINIVENVGFTELLNGLVTLDSIILGFLGAMIPVVLSMKNESKFVRYVFQNDKDGLFSKYMKSTIFLGLVNAGVSLLLHVRSAMSENAVSMLFYGWVFLSLAFLLCTYRSMSYMITLVFRKDEMLAEDGGKKTITSEREQELKEKYMKK